MVDAVLPIERRPRPLRHVFLDLNAYFASVEQQERPELRGRPVAVCPVMADTSFCIAASYEAKAFGIKTGTQVGEAKRRCPEIALIPATPQLYVAYHKRVLEAVETVLPIEEVCSIDEMRFRLLGKECDPEVARGLALQLKEAIRDHVGSWMRCSIGIAPNAFLAKVGTELQKPDGLVVIESQDLPEKIQHLRLTDFPGINRRMQARLHAHSIFDTPTMLAASREALIAAFGSIVGERWWYLLRGFDLSHETRHRRTLGHSHVLPPEQRTDAGCREVLLRLLQKASARLRASKLWTTSLTVAVKGFDKSWEARAKLPPTQDTVLLNAEFLKLWEGRDFVWPRLVAVTFADLREAEHVTPSLFDEANDHAALNAAVDELNQKFGKHTVFLAGMEHAREAAPERIAFQKTDLFSEGRGDGEWVDTFRGLRDA